MGTVFYPKDETVSFTSTKYIVLRYWFAVKGLNALDQKFLDRHCIGCVCSTESEEGNKLKCSQRSRVNRSCSCSNDSSQSSRNRSQTVKLSRRIACQSL